MTASLNSITRLNKFPLFRVIVLQTAVVASIDSQSLDSLFQNQGSDVVYVFVCFAIEEYVINVTHVDNVPESIKRGMTLFKKKRHAYQVFKTGLRKVI